MAWLQENGLTLLFFIFFLGVVFRGPILARLFRVVDISVHDLSAKLNAPTPPLLLDVRSQSEFNAGHIKQAILIPRPEIASRAPALIKQYPNREVAVICQTGNRSLLASVSLKRMGLATVYNVSGGMSHWESQAYPVKR